MKRRVTLYVDDQLWREFRATCVRRGLTASAVVEMGIHEQMLQWAVEQVQADVKKDPDHTEDV
jgi:hypothetical protein